MNALLLLLLDSRAPAGAQHHSGGMEAAVMAGLVTDLNTLIPPDSGWELQSAEDINNAGQIVGAGTIHGQHHAFLLTPAAS